MTRYGAEPADWQHLDRLGMGPDLLPVVSRPLTAGAKISPKSAMKVPGKTPSLYNGGQMVVGIPQWTAHQATPKELLRWSSEPDYGICIQTRETRCLDIDVSAPAVVAAILRAVADALGITFPKRWRQNSAKCLLAFKLVGIFPKRVMRVEGGMIEFLGNGQQFIAIGTHPSGARYEWEGGLPAEIPELTPEQFETLWSSLEIQFAIDTPTISSATERKRGDDIDIADPVADWLQEQGLVLGEDRRGGLLIECPWTAEHSAGEPGDSSTVWFPAGTNGHPTGHFKCLHAHCEGRNRSDFLAAVGYDAGVADEFEDLGPDPDRENSGGANDAISENAPSGKSGFTLIQAAEFAAQPSGRWLVKGLIPMEELVIVYGASGAGKSFVMIDLAMAVARGVPWRGCKVRQGKVIYIAAEGGGGVRKRLTAYAQHHAVSLGSVPFYVIHASPNLLDKAQVKALIDAINGLEDVAMIICDTFAQMTAGANENAAEDMGLAIAHVRAVGRRSGATTVLVHHAGKDAAKGARGWSGLKAAADAEVEVTRDGDDRAINTTKQKDADDGASWGFKLERVAIGMDDDGDIVESCVIVESDVEVEAGVNGGRRKAKPSRRPAPWEQVLLDTFQELAIGGDVLKTELILRAANKRSEEEAGTLRDRKKNAGKVLARMSRGDGAAFISSKEDDYVSLVQ
jgi:KaiC/GvpD/RAD55 family RecA-like ATPase